MRSLLGLVEGKEVRSCIMPLSAVANQEITTLEGLPARWAKQKGLSADEAAEDAAPCPASLDRGANSSLRLLPERHDDQGDRTAREQPDPTVAQIKEAFTTSGPHRISAAAEATPPSLKPCNTPPR